MPIYIYWVFSSSRNEEKKNLCEKRKKKRCRTGWATAQTMSRYNGKLYRNIAF